MAILSNLTNGQLAEHMGPYATPYEAKHLRRYMLEAGHHDTRDVPDDEWADFLAWAARDADATDPDPRDYADA